MLVSRQQIERRTTVPFVKTTQTSREPLVYRHKAWTRLTHWIWVLSLFFLLLSGLQIFNAHPTLYIGQQSGFQYDNAVLSIGAVDTPDGPQGRTRIFGRDFNTTGFLGLSGSAGEQQFRGFPAALTIPSYQDLATGRVVACPEGITRATVIEICAAEKIRCTETDLSLIDIYAAHEMFCTGTMGELAGVVRVDNRQMGDGNIGPMT